ncbi:ABC transporter permease subunit [Alloscardovia criceti]|uniref:ABC transporter permease subunit n=1 Tax=Alloscardovia criceti TaxID=356828 RepID=UPI00037241BD|nr:ABC transporter permease subunit [Alloscardovia criceti]
MFAVLRYDLLRGWHALLVWCAALVGVLVLYSAFYPSMGMGDGMSELLQQLPQGLVEALGFTDITSGAGWVHSTFFSLLGLFLLVGAAVSWGSAAVAGAQESGFLELTLSRGVSRTAYFCGRLLGIIVRFLIVGLIIALSLFVINEPAELSLQFDNVPAQMCAFLALGVLASSISLAIGSVTGVRQWSIGAGAFIIVLAYALNMIGRSADSYDWLQDVSPISWVYKNTPLIHGWQLTGLAITLGVSILFIVIGLIAINTRDLDN